MGEHQTPSEGSAFEPDDVQHLLAEITRLTQENEALRAVAAGAIELAAAAHRAEQSNAQRVRQYQLGQALEKWKKRPGRPKKPEGDQLTLELYADASRMFQLQEGRNPKSQSEVFRLIVQFMEKRSGRRWSPKERRAATKSLGNRLGEIKASR